MIELLTKLQKKVFNYICEFSTKEGFPPSYSEIAAHFGFSSDGTVRTYLELLEKKGFIQRLGKARGIKILKPLIPTAIPILGHIAAGVPKLAIEDYVGSVSDIRELEYQPDRFALQIKGDSMKDAGILNGDLAIIQKSVSVENSQIAAVSLEGEATLKRVFYEKDRIRLQPENAQYTPIYITPMQKNAVIIGRMIALIRRGV